MAKLTEDDRNDCVAIIGLIRDERLSNADIATSLDMAVERVSKLVGKMRLAGTNMPDRRGATPDVVGKEFLANL